MLSKSVFAQVMAMLCEVYDKELTKTLNNTYYFVLQDMEDEDFRQAVKTMLKLRIFATLPKPAEILQYSNIKEVLENKPDRTKEKAKELIALMEATNTNLGEQAKAKGEDFVKLVKYGIKLTLPKEDIAILDMVKPYNNHKDLIIKIRHYQTSADSLNAFVNAIKYFDRIGGTEAIENKSLNALQIRRG